MLIKKTLKFALKSLTTIQLEEREEFFILKLIWANYGPRAESVSLLVNPIHQKIYLNYDVI